MEQGSRPARAAGREESSEPEGMVMVVQPGREGPGEGPAIWWGVHAAFLAGIFERLGPAVRPKYAVRYEERVFIMSEDDPAYRVVVPDVRVIEREAGRRAAGGAPAAGRAAIAEPVPV